MKSIVKSRSQIYRQEDIIIYMNKSHFLLAAALLALAVLAAANSISVWVR